MTDLETVKELAGTYDMDSPVFYNALDRVLKKFEEQQEQYENELRDKEMQIVQLFTQWESAQNMVETLQLFIKENQDEKLDIILNTPKRK